jgi:hypothetical protein
MARAEVPESGSSRLGWMNFWNSIFGILRSRKLQLNTCPVTQ